MKIAVASGKGGTGKTTVACALASAYEPPVSLLDCDVEEPNSHFFIRPDIDRVEEVLRPVPRVDAKKCTGCGACGRICRFGAVAIPGGRPLIFNDLCHGCGGCARICPTGAIEEVGIPMGTLRFGHRDGLRFISGQLHVGQAMSPPLIRETLRHAGSEGLTIVDCPPGTSCPFVTAVRGCDVALLVTEPTPFGLHDLTLAVETLRELGLPFAVAVNRMTEKRNLISRFCEEECIPLLLQIPESRRVAEAYSRGEIITAVMPRLSDPLAALPHKLRQLTASSGDESLSPGRPA